MVGSAPRTAGGAFAVPRLRRRMSTLDLEESRAGIVSIGGSVMRPLPTHKSAQRTALDSMATLPVLCYPDPRLRTVAEPVATMDDSIRRLIEDLLETMYAAPGIGLAATQVNVHKRVLVIDLSEQRNQPHVFVNPVIEFTEGTQQTDEGCLSVPGFYEAVERASRIRVAALGRDGKPFELEAEELLAVCIQHECDHLDGKLFVDRISGLKRQRIKNKLRKQNAADGQRRRSGSKARA